MDIDLIADKLMQATIVSGYFYPWNNPRGYRATVRVGNEWYWFSVSNTNQPVSPTQVAHAIRSKDRYIERSKPYKQGRGFEATVRCGDHWYMLGHGNNQK
jgi:hypothetical protein